MQSALHFRTTDGAQALALALAGFELIAFENVYWPDQLAKLGCTARQAWQDGKPGVIEYFFAMSEEVLRCAAAFNEERDKLKTPGAEGTTLPNVMPEDVVRITAAVLVQRKDWADMWKRRVPQLHIPGEGQPQRSEAGGEVRILMPGFKRISINDTETLQRLG